MNLSLGFTKQVGIFFYEIAKFLCWLLPLLFFSYLGLNFFLYYLFPDFPIEFSEKTILSLTSEDLGILLIIVFFLTIVGIYIRHREKKIVIKFLRFKSRDEWLVALITSFFFSIFFIKSFFELKKFEPIYILISTIFILAFLPQFVLFYSFVDLSYFKKLIATSAEKKPSLSEIKRLFMPIMPVVKKTILIFVSLSLLFLIFLYLASIFKNLPTLAQVKVIEIILLTLAFCLFGYSVSVYGLTYLGYIRKLKADFFKIKEYLIRTLHQFWKAIKTTTSAEKKPSLSEIKRLFMPIMPVVKKTILIFVSLSLLFLIFLYLASIFKNLPTLAQVKVIEIILLTLAFCLFGYLIFVSGKKLKYLSLSLLRKLITYFSENKESLISSLNLLWNLIKMTVAGVVVVSLFAITVIFIVGFLTWQLNRYSDFQRRLRENLTIISVVPSTTTLAQKVKLKGYNFGWRVNQKDGLMSSYGTVFVDEWKGEELIFTVPLHWEEGMVNLWIEKIKDDVPEKKLIKSNIVSLKILSRWDFFPIEEELRRKDPLSYLKRAVKKIRRTLFLQRPYFSD